MLTKKAKSLYDSLIEELGSSQIDLLDELLKEIEYPINMPRLYKTNGERINQLNFESILSNYINGNLKAFRRELDSMDSKELADFVVYCEDTYPQLDSKEIAHQLKLINN